jgi:hypothetical protein
MGRSSEAWSNLTLPDDLLSQNRRLQDGRAGTPASPSMGSPLAAIFSTPSGNCRCSLQASSHGADSHA